MKKRNIYLITFLLGISSGMLVGYLTKTSEQVEPKFIETKIKDLGTANQEQIPNFKFEDFKKPNLEKEFEKNKNADLKEREFNDH